MRSTDVRERPKDRLIETIAYLISSANILPNEPVIYGPMRLLEGAKRIIEFLEEEEGLADKELLNIKEKIDDAMSKVLTDEEGFKAGINEVIKLMANYLRNHYPGK